MMLTATTHNTTQALDIDTAWMVVACHRTQQHLPPQHHDNTQPAMRDEGSNA